MGSHKWFLKGCIGLLILFWHPSGAQYITEPDPSVRFDKKKGLIVLYSNTDGSFFLNYHFLTELKENDTIYLANMVPGNYSARFISAGTTKELMLDVNALELTELTFGGDSISMSAGSKYELYDRANRIHGKKFYYGRKGCFYNDTHVALYSFGTETSDDGAFNSWTTINGYIIVPGFCIGLGIAYHHLNDQYLGYNYDYYVNVYQDVSYIPVFLDIRSYFSPRKVTPFLKLDLGHNFLVSGKDESDYIYVDKGKVFISPGIGLKIYCSDLVQISTAFEYSFEQFTVHNTYSTRNISNNYLKFTLGIGFQKNRENH